ncbi:hypothetical protein OVS_00190 [Mycoplasma ovis str. Michigan]|uniref:Uncharacterized protein n=1 Tax=Mycoplasma ovis str. Michigan TaxID=1415773 RepID=A0ABN4BL79_9MOLU|nr:hypothetical protein OVS_00190 [Mycoplasma ovis str. Michigan]
MSKHNCYSISTKVNSDGKLLVCSNNKYYLYKNSLEELTDVKINNNKILAKLANQTQTQEEDKTFSWEIENQEWEPSSQDISLALSSIKPIEGSGLPKEENYCFLVYELNDNRDAKIFCSWSSTKDAGFIKLIPF